MTVQHINSESWCRKAYLNYHCYDNTMGLSPADMGEITQTWSHRLTSWQNSVSSDETEYDFDDSEYASYKENGEEAAKEASGHDGKQGGQITRTVGDATFGVAGALGSTIGRNVANTVVQSVGGKFLGNIMGKAAGKIAEKTASKALAKATEKGIEKGAEEAAKKAAEETGQKAAEKATKNIGWIITAPLALATGIAYLAKKPNKEEKEACDALQGEMTAAQEVLSTTQGDMQTYGEEVVELSDEATTLNEDTNEQLEEQKTEYDMYYETLMNIQAKIDAGEELTESEKELYKSVVGYLQEIGINIEELTEDTTDEVEALYEEVGEYQEGFDDAAQTMGEIEGLTDFAESIDESTRTMCYVEAVAQGLNAASGGKAAYEAGAFALSGGLFTAWAWAFAAMGASGAVMSGVGVTQQIKWAGDVGTEIEMRRATQDLNTETLDIYDEQIDYYDGYMQGIEDLELEIPEDVAPPEEVTVPTGTSATQGEETPTPTSGTSSDNDTNNVSGNDNDKLVTNESGNSTDVQSNKNINNTGNAGTTNTGNNSSSQTPSSRDYVKYTDIVKDKVTNPVLENDNKNRVIISQVYANAITTTLNLPNATSGDKFAAEAIPDIISKLIPGFSKEDIANVMEGKTLTSTYDANLVQTLTGKDTGKNTTVDNSENLTANLRKVINFYKPIFTAASARGWSC